MNMMKKKKILVIEDDRDINRTLEIHLTNLGFDVLKSFDGEDGLRKIKTQDPDLVVLDLRLPGLTGEALCREIKRSEEYKHIPVIMLTAKDTDADKVIGRVIGAEVYLTKPCDLDILEQKISLLIGTP